MRHYSWIRDKFEGEPVFSPDDLELKVKLRNVYVRLRCVQHEEIEKENDEERIPIRKHPSDKKKGTYRAYQHFA